MVKRGADVECLCDGEQKTPLWIAAENGHAEVVRESEKERGAKRRGGRGGEEGVEEIEQLATSMFFLLISG